MGMFIANVYFYLNKICLSHIRAHELIECFNAFPINNKKRHNNTSQINNKVHFANVSKNIYYYTIK